MNIYEEVWTEPQKPHLYRRFVKKVCDLGCGTEGKGSVDNWEDEYWQEEETHMTVEIYHKKGSNYPEGAYGKRLTVDICPKCFQEKLIPWLKSQGAKLEYEKYDY